jgi:colanic acid/amylovoran biosynthesis glycosyltransferase
MRIAYLASRYPALSQAFLTREVRALRALGVEVETISVRRARSEEPLGEEDREEAERTFNLLPAGPLVLLRAHAGAIARGPREYVSTLARAWRLAGPGLRSHLWSLFYFSEALILRRHCRRRGIEHIHAVQFADAAGDVALLAAAPSPAGEGRRRVSIAIHGPGEFSEVTRYGLREKVRGAELVAAVSEFTRSQLMALVEERHADRIRVVHMGVDTERYTPSEGSGRSGSGVRVLCVARLVRHKGHATLLRALAALARDGLQLEATLVGEGPERGELERLAAELGIGGQVRFAGPLGQDELPAVYRDHDVFCLPTLSEAVGVVNMEAMACGLPVVSSELMGVPELIEDGTNGLLVTPGREGELAAALRRLAEDPGLRTRMGMAGRRTVEERFDSATEAAKLRDLLEELCFSPAAS